MTALVGPVDLVIRSTAILTPEAIEREIPLSGFIAVRDGVIVEVGETAAVDKWAAVATRVIDVGDAVVAPGLVDAHMHPILGLDIARGLELTGRITCTQVRAAIREYITTLASDDWVLGWGLDPSSFEDGPFDNRVLDGVADGRLVYLSMFDAHSALVSARVLTEAGIDGTTTFSDSARVGLDQAGIPNGMLFEMSALALVRKILPVADFESRLKRLHAVLLGMAQSGLVAGQMLDLDASDSFELLAELERRGELPIRLRISPWVDAGASIERLEQLAAMQGMHGRRWFVRGIKLMIDGTIDNGTAWLDEPDTRGESTSPLWLDTGQYVAAVQFFHTRSIPTTTHAIGDRGVEFVARTLGDLPANGLVHRIEHIESVPDAVIELIAEAGVAASMQPTHCSHALRADHSDNWSTRLGPTRANRAFRTRDLLDRGVTLALGSDWPIATYDPRIVIASAQLRRPPEHPEIVPIQPAQALTATEAFDGYTRAFYRSVGEEGGELIQGGLADITVFACNPLTTSPDIFVGGEIVLTVVGGSPVIPIVDIPSAV